MKISWAGCRLARGLFISIGLAIGVLVLANQASASSVPQSEMHTSLKQKAPEIPNLSQFQVFGEIEAPPPNNPDGVDSLSVVILITENGLSPLDLTVTAGSTLTWINQTDQVVQLQSGVLKKAFLPVIVKNSTGNMPSNEPDFLPDAAASDTFSATIEPGGKFSHTFAATSVNPYFLLSDRYYSGVVNVVDYIPVFGTITQDTRWEYATYLLTCSVEVPNGVTLSVANGAVIKMVGDLYVHGTLTTTGTLEEPVVFTSYKDDSVGGDTNGDGSASSPAVGDWRTVFVHGDGAAELEHTELRYGGANWAWPYYTGMGNLYNEGGIVHMGHVTSTLGAYGVWGNGGALEVEDSLFSGNATQGMKITGGTAAITRSTLQGNGEHGAYFTNVSAPLITWNTFSSNVGKAIYMSQPNIPLDTSQVYSNTVTGNGTNGFWIEGGLSGVSTIASFMETQPELPYVFNYLSLNSGAQVSVANGAVIKMVGDLYVHGTLTTTGTLEEPVVFTSYKDDSVGGDTNGDCVASSPAIGDWRTVFVHSDGAAELEHTELRYGGANWGSPYYTTMGNLYNEGGIVHMGHVTSTLGAYGVWGNGGTLEVEDSLFSGNATQGMKITGGTAATITNSTIGYNPTGIEFGGSIGPTITNNSIFNNTSWGLNNISLFTILAENNWWGNASGPVNASNPGGTGDPVSNFVDFSPWLLTAP